MNEKIKTYIINDIDIIYTIRLNDKILIIHNNEKPNEILTDYEFFERYKTYY